MTLLNAGRIDDREAAPPTGAFRLPDYRRFDLDGGLRLLWVEHAGSPLLHLCARIDVGAVHDPCGHEGVAALTTALLKAGAGHRDTSAIAEALEDVGADVLTRTDWDGSMVGIELLAADAERAASLFSDLLWRPRFERGPCESFRLRRLARLRHSAWNAIDLSTHVLARALYGDTRFGRPLTGDAETLAKLGRDDVANFHQQQFGPAATLIVAVGGHGPDALARLLDRAPVHDRTRERPASSDASAADVSPPRTWIVDRPDAPHVVLQLGHIGPSGLDPDFVSVELLVALLSVRLQRTLRDMLGHTYGVRADLTAARGAGPLAVSLSVATSSVGLAVREVVREIERMRDESIADGDLETVVDDLMGSFLRSLQPAHGVAAYVVAASAGPGLDRWRLLQQLRGIDPETLRLVARRHLHPNRLTTVAVGPAATLRTQLDWLDPTVVPASLDLPGPGVNS